MLFVHLRKGNCAFLFKLIYVLIFNECITSYYMRGVTERGKDKHTRTHERAGARTCVHFVAKLRCREPLCKMRLSGWTIYVSITFSRNPIGPPSDIIIPSPLVSSTDWRVFRCPRPLGDIDPRESGHGSFYVWFIAVTFLFLKIFVASAQILRILLCSRPLFHFRLDAIDVSTSISSSRLRLCCGVILGVSRQCGGC